MTRSENANRILAGLAEVADIVEDRAEAARIFVPETVDVKAIREDLGLTQKAFALRYGFSPSAVADWEQDRRRPEASARVLLKVIAKDHAAVDRALAAA